MASPAGSPRPDTTAAASAALGTTAEPPPGADSAGPVSQKGDDVVLDVTALGGGAGVGMTPAVAPSSASDQVQGAPGGATGVANSGAGGPPGGPSASSVDAISASLKAEILKEMRAAVLEEEQQPWIWKVHPSIRAHEGEAYGPKLVSIGPLHHGEDILLPMEQIKLMFLTYLFGRNVEDKLGNCIRAVHECEPQARRQYAERVDLGVKEFVKILVLDGCFIIHCCIKRHLDKRPNSQLAVRYGPYGSGVGVRCGFSHLRRDLMLLENQIPFFVLVRLLEQCEIPYLHRPTLIEITLAFLGVKLPRDQHPQVDQIHHLLHLHHLCLDPSRVPNMAPRCSSSSSCNLLLYPIKNPINSIMFVFLALFYLLKIHKWHKYCCPTEKSKVPRMIPCAAELLTAGVKFKKDNNKVSSLVKVSFTDGILEIPVLRVQESTSSELRNLIALEQCCPQVGSYFTSYAVFMDNLIDTESDVAILKKYGILESKLGNDEEVAKMFNTLCKGTHLNYERHSNASVFSDLNAYFNVPHHKWRASLKSTYFSNPWNIISLFAGIVLLFLTAVQSYFTVFPKKSDH